MTVLLVTAMAVAGFARVERRRGGPVEPWPDADSSSVARATSEPPPVILAEADS